MAQNMVYPRALEKNVHSIIAGCCIICMLKEVESIVQISHIIANFCLVVLAIAKVRMLKSPVMIVGLSVSL